MPEARLRFFGENNLLTVFVSSPAQFVLVVQENLETRGWHHGSDPLDHFGGDLRRMNDDSQFGIDIERALIPVE